MTRTPRRINNLRPPRTPKPPPPTLEAGPEDVEEVPAAAPPDGALGPQIMAGPTSVPGFQLCETAGVERLLALLEGGSLMTGVEISAGTRLAFAAHQVRIALSSVPNAVATDDVEKTTRFLLASFAQLVGQIIPAPCDLAVVDRPAPT